MTDELQRDTLEYIVISMLPDILTDNPGNSGWWLSVY